LRNRALRNAQAAQKPAHHTAACLKDRIENGANPLPIPPEALPAALARPLRYHHPPS
jgi:hypothetical protein